MSNSVDLSQKTFLLVSGASKGIGQMMAVQCAARMAPGSLCVLLARSSAGLDETKQKIQLVNANVMVKTYPIDLSSPTPDQLEAVFDHLFDDHSPPNTFQLAMVIHNVGTIGNISREASAFDDLAEWRAFFDTNVFAVASLNCHFLRRFQTHVRTVVVNVTSKCGQVPFRSFTQYCTSRAAREMYFKVLAAESEQLIVLNYSPGVVDTDMTVDVQANSADGGLRNTFREMRDSKTMIQPIETADKLVAVLSAGAFTSGDKVDYYSA